MLLSHIGFNLVIADETIRGLVLMFLLELPPLHIRDPKYLKVIEKHSIISILFILHPIHNYQTTVKVVESFYKIASFS